MTIDRLIQMAFRCFVFELKPCLSCLTDCSSDLDHNDNNHRLDMATPIPKTSGSTTDRLLSMPSWLWTCLQSPTEFTKTFTSRVRGRASICLSTMSISNPTEMQFNTTFKTTRTFRKRTNLKKFLKYFNF